MRSRIPLILLTLLALFALPAMARAAEVMPPKPAEYFNDYAGAVKDPAVATELNDKLRDFERQTSNQFVVAIYPKLQSDSDAADYCTRVAQSWGVGQKDKKNGVVLFVFIQDHKIQIAVGYGLEGALPDITCKQIIDNEIKPAFKAGNYGQGLQAGVTAIIAATKGEYKGTGKVAGDNSSSKSEPLLIFFLIFLIIFALRYFSNRSGGGSGFFFSSLGSGNSGGFFGGGGFSGGGGGGGFSGGGGSFGGGGAGGSW